MKRWILAAATTAVAVVTALALGAGSAKALVTEIHVTKSLDSGSPAYFKVGDEVTFSYLVTGNNVLYNVGVEDDLCGTATLTGGYLPGSTTYTSGGDPGGIVGGVYTAGAPDGVLNGWAGEKWVFKCTMTLPSFSGLDPLVNTATVSGYHPYEQGTEGTRLYQDTDSYTLYPFVLRKDVVLYNNGGTAPFADDTAFTVQPSAGSAFAISESSPAYLYLTSGAWTFHELGLPTGFFPFYAGDGLISYTTGEGYPDWTEINVTWNGCSLGFWKNLDVWPVGSKGGGVHELLPNVPGVFAVPPGPTQLGALSLKGGPGVQGATDLLVKQFVAAYLNEKLFGASFGPYTTVLELRTAVNDAIGTGDRGTMLALQQLLDSWNNGVCRFAG